MAYIRALYRRGICYTIYLPLLIALLYAVSGQLFYILLFVAALLLSIAITPAYKKIENCSIFALLTISSIPINLRIVLMIARSSFVQSYARKQLLVIFMIDLLAYGMLFSIEQIAVGILARLLWPKQAAGRSDSSLREKSPIIISDDTEEDHK